MRAVRVRAATISTMDETERWRGVVERLGWGGVGVARADDGRVILLTAPLALFPGEEVEADMCWRARHGEGRVMAWHTRDPRRAAAECPVATQCGGCDLWEAGEAASELKRLMVDDLLVRSLRGVVPPELEWLPAPPEARRQRIQLHWDGQRLGYHARGTHDIVPVAGCPQAAAQLSEAIPRLAEALAAGELPAEAERWELAGGTPPDDVFATASASRTPACSWKLDREKWQPYTGFIWHQRADLRLRQHSSAFAQPCFSWAAEAFARVLAGWDLRGATLYDLYSGGGLFSLLLSGQFERYYLVESSAEAVADARENMQAAGMARYEVVEDAVERWLPRNLGGVDDVILLDPPRAGLPESVADRLVSSPAKTVVLVGCDGAAFCRDVKRLAVNRRLSRLAALDLFPNTAQVEFVGLLRREQ